MQQRHGGAVDGHVVTAKVQTKVSTCSEQVLRLILIVEPNADDACECRSAASQHWKIGALPVQCGRRSERSVSRCLLCGTADKIHAQGFLALGY